MLGNETGCAKCRESWKTLEPEGGPLLGGAIERARYDKDVYTYVSYESAAIQRCPACGTRWLVQYWELESAETEFEEWGERHWAVSPLDYEDVAIILAAQTTGQPLPHDYFSRRKPPT